MMGGFVGVFVKIVGSFENVICMKVSKFNGYVWVVGMGNDVSVLGFGNVMCYDGMLWIMIMGGLLYLMLYFINVLKVFVFGSGGYYGSIVNVMVGSLIIVYMIGYKIVFFDIFVLVWMNESFMLLGDVMYYFMQECIFMFEGIGVFDLVNLLMIVVVIDWVENCKGIENFVV